MTDKVIELFKARLVKSGAPEEKLPDSEAVFQEMESRLIGTMAFSIKGLKIPMNDEEQELFKKRLARETEAKMRL